MNTILSTKHIHAFKNILIPNEYRDSNKLIYLWYLDECSSWNELILCAITFGFWVLHHETTSGNCRPISNLSFISKILEQVVAKHLSSHKPVRVCMSPFNQHIVWDTQRRWQLCECRMISWKPLMVENVFFSYSSICQQPSTLSLIIFFWIDFQQTLPSLALICHGYHPISQIEHSQCLFLGSIPIRPTSAMVFYKVLSRPGSILRL